MIDQTKKPPVPSPAAIRDLAVAEVESVSGGLGISVKDQERLEQQSRLTDAYMSHRRFILF